MSLDDFRKQHTIGRPFNVPQIGNYPATDLSAHGPKGEDYYRQSMRFHPKPNNLKGTLLCLAYWFQTVIDRMTPENMRILKWEEKAIGDMKKGDSGEEGMVVDACF